MKFVILRIMIFCLNFIYFFIKLLPQQDKVVFMSRQSNNVNTDFLLLGNELKKRHKVVYLCKTLDKNVKSIISYGMHIFKQMYHLSTARVCVLASYIPTVSILHHKKNIKIIQIWHSIGIMKEFGYAILDKEEGNSTKMAKVMKQHKNYDIIFCSSDECKEVLARGFGYNKEILKNMTLPRVDLLLDKEYQQNKRKEILKRYPMLAEKENIIYCPTFRKNEERLEEKIKEVIENVDYKKYNLIIKLHPITKINIKTKNAILDNKFSTLEILSIADKVLSDYSGLIYEAGILNIPVYLYIFDIDDYEVTRGLAIKYSELPEYKSSNLKEVLTSFEKQYDYEYLKKFTKKYVSNYKNCTQKMVNEIEKYL